MKLYTLIHNNCEDWEDNEDTLIYITESLDNAKDLVNEYGYHRDEKYYGLRYEKFGLDEYRQESVIGVITIKEVETDTLLF